MTISSAIGSLTWSLHGAVFVLFLSRELRMEPGPLGAIFASAGAGSLVGAVLAGRAARQFGIGPAIIWGTLLVGIGRLLIPFAGGSLIVASGLLIVAQIMAGIGGPIYSINQLSLRQAITPDDILGRVNASRQVIVFGVGPLGALLGGLLGEYIGLRGALLCGAVGMFVAFLWALLSPLRNAREAPALAA